MSSSNKIVARHSTALFGFCIDWDGLKQNSFDFTGHNFMDQLTSFKSPAQSTWIATAIKWMHCKLYLWSSLRIFIQTQVLKWNLFYKFIFASFYLQQVFKMNQILMQYLLNLRWNFWHNILKIHMAIICNKRAYYSKSTPIVQNRSPYTENFLLFELCFEKKSLPSTP